MLLKAQGITKRYGPSTVLEDAAFTVYEGEVLGLFGPNGAGKTTLFECLAGLLPADGGSVEFRGEALSAGHRKQAPWSENDNVGRCFQDHLGGTIASFQPTDKRGFFRMFANVVYAGHKFQPKIRLRNEIQEVQTQQQLYNTQVFFAFESAVSEHMVYLKQFLRAALYQRKLTGIGDMLRNSFAMARYLAPLMWKYAWDHRVFVPSSAKIQMHVQAEHAACAESRITVDRSAVDRSE